MDIQKEREAFESLWIQSNGHFKYFVFSQKHGKYIPTGVRDNLTDQELLFASITLNTAYLFFLGGIKTQAIPDGFVLVNSERLNELRDQALTAKYASLNNDSDHIFGDIEDIQLSLETMIEAAEVK